MPRLTHKLATALLGLGALAGTFAEAQACPGGGGGRGFGGYHRPAYHAPPRYVQPAPQPYYHQPAYQQPTYQQPAYGQPMGGYGEPSFGQSAPQIAAQPRSSAAPSGLPPTVKRLANPRPTAANAQFAPQQQPAPQLRNPQVVASQPLTSLAAQPNRQPAPRSLAGNQPNGNPLQALGGSPIEQEGPSVQPQQTQSRPQIARRPQPQTAQPQQPEQEASPMEEAQLSALAALGGFESNEPQPSDVSADEPVDQSAEQPEQFEVSQEQPQSIQASRTGSRPLNRPMHVGTWTAQLQNGSKVELALQPDGRFSWVATSGEKVSSFEGDYTVSGGSLTLVRSSDNQKLIGSMTPSGASSFTFKLTGTKDAGLNFSRS